MLRVSIGATRPTVSLCVDRLGLGESYKVKRMCNEASNNLVEV